MTTDEYKTSQQACENLCDVTDELVAERDFMKCVTCPFCKSTVDAVVTEKTIACPKCKVEVQR